ncbi:MAG: hypothetical protein AB7S38_25185 [Vulcanimicrobiota bacterium]
MQIFNPYQYQLREKTVSDTQTELACSLLAALSKITAAIAR